MAVKIFIKRKASEVHVIELTMLLKKLRGLTLSQPGYISGETLQRIDEPGETMVISTWRSVEDWNKWVNNEKRMMIQGEIDQILDQETEYAIYG
ncbi:antibiotic biosynthesis monooxygenase family protein [Desulfopila inferna]|uniref:antibiotic biosynthesis monooxygenase family protein n=1 Tax=Desulfopila inferna TaxID=468528 RepID=UPI001963E8EB|nr:antibiotic biosynthesis monooxygenase family protein [Desulfopila inferna]MBM9604365.1 antibiotic biosynthesis monooxygenase [Desulfopila inferna]